MSYPSNESSAGSNPATPPQPPMTAPQYNVPPMPYMMPYPNFQVIERVEKQVNQLPLVAMILSIVAWPLLITAPETGNWDFFAGVVAIPAVVMAHMALARPPEARRSSGYGMAIAALVIGYLLLSITLAWGVIRFFPTGSSVTPV